jgi:hypothetical protein
MNDPEKIPMLLEFLFGKNASMAMRTAISKPPSEPNSSGRHS